MVTAHMASSPKTDVDTTSWLTRIQAADTMNVSTQTIEKWERDGKLHARTRRGNGLPPHKIYDPQELARIPIRGRRLPPKTAGEIEGRIFELLGAGVSMIDIVIMTEQTLKHVEAVRERWEALGGSRTEITHRQRQLLISLVGNFEGVDELIAKIGAAIERVSIEIDGAVHESRTDAEIEHGIVAALDAADRRP